MTWAGDPYFKKSEVDCKCGCGGVPTDEFMGLVVTLREEAAFPFIISSGYRCPKHNAAVSKTGDDGPHTRALAVDVLIHGYEALRLIALAKKHGFTGVGVSQKGDMEKRFIHLDNVPVGDKDIPRPAFWSY